MPKPTRSDVRAVDPVLTNLLVGFMNEDAAYVANQAVDAIPVTSSAGTYFIFDKKYWFQDDMPNRAWGGDYATGGFGLSTSTYETEQYAKSFVIPDETRAYFLKQPIPHGISAKLERKGTGVGVLIARLIFRRYGGDLELLWSEPGKGTALRIMLPCAHESTPKEE